MEFKNLSTTLWDKYNPMIVLEELQKTGVSTRPRDKMTQQHRIDRIIPYLIENADVEGLCKSITIIFSRKYPVSEIALSMAHEYLWQLRPSYINNAPLLKNVIDTLDTINPHQIIEDLDKGHLYTNNQFDIENRINKGIERLVVEKNIHGLNKLIALMVLKSTKEVPVTSSKRVIQYAYDSLQEHIDTTNHLKTLLVERFGAEEKK